MTTSHKGKPRNDAPAAKTPQPPQAVDVVDGIPDRSAKRSAWKYVALAVIFGLWVAFLVYVLIAGAKG